MELLLLFIISVLASEENEPASENYEPNKLEKSQNEILVKIEEDEYVKTNNSHFIGVSYNKQTETWRAQRWSKTEHKMVYNGYYKDEETAAYASDTLGRKLIANGEKGHKLNFPDDDNEVYPEKSSDYVGVNCSKRDTTWRAFRRSKEVSKMVYNGSYKNEDTAAHASDTLARKLIANGEKGHKLNFPDDDIEVHNVTEKSSDFFGVTYSKKDKTWRAQRWSKHENKLFSNGSYKDEETAAHASDTLARELIANGEKGHKLNFSDNDTEVNPKIQNNKRKRSADFNNSQTCGRLFDK